MSGSERGEPQKLSSRSAANERRARPRGGSGDVGRALRTVYDNTLREDIPDDFANLLDKLS